MFKPASPRPIIIHNPPKKEITENANTDKNALRAQIKTTNFGLELFKFISPAEIGWYTQDLEKVPQKGYQGAIVNNFAWWTDSQHYIMKNTYKDQAITKDNIKLLEASLYDPYRALQTQNWHDPYSASNDAEYQKMLQENIPEDQWSQELKDRINNYYSYPNKKFFGRTHRSSPLFSGGPYAGAYSGRLWDINPYAGIAGGYSANGFSSSFDYKNTWNHFEIAEKAKKDKYDYNMSNNYQSISALSDNDWEFMNQKLAEISAQAIYYKNINQGFTNKVTVTQTDQDGKQTSTIYDFHDTGLRDSDVFNQQWIPDYGHAKSAVSSISKRYFKQGDSTQAPNYYEIIMSGIWSQWSKGNQGSITQENIDGEKFYYFLKSMLESKRRGLEAYRNLLGKTTDLAKNSNDNIRQGTASKEEIEAQLTKSKKQVSSIKEWYNNVTSKIPTVDSQFNMMFYRITHGFFNNLEAITSRVEKQSGGQNYGDIEEIDAFFKAAMPAIKKYLSESGKFNEIRNQVSDTSSIIDSILNTTDSDTIRTKLVSLAQTIASKIRNSSSEADKIKYLKFYNYIAPVGELYLQQQGAEANCTVPVVNFASYKTDQNGNPITPSISDIEWEYVPHSILYEDHNAVSYDGYVQYRGSGFSWLGNGNRRDGVQTIFRINPLKNQLGNNIAPITKLDASGNYGPDGTEEQQDNFILTNDWKWLLGKQNRAKGYLWADGSFRNYPDPNASEYGEKGAMPEIEENPAYAAAAYYWETQSQRETDQLESIILMNVELTRYRQDKARYEELMDQYNQDELEESRIEAQIQAQARQREKQFERALERSRAERRRSQR